MVTDAPLPRMNGDFLVRPRLLELLDQWSPVTVVLAPSGAGKAVLAVQWAVHARAEGHDVIWLDGEVDEPGDVVAALARHAGVPVDDDPAVTLRRLRRDLRDLDRRLAVVVNNAEPLVAAIGDELVEIVRDCREVHLVVCLRRRLDPVAKALLEAETRVVGLRDLQFTVAEVQDLARQHGLELAVDEAERIRASVGGWSALVRTGLESLPDLDQQRVTVWSPRHVGWFLAVNVVPVLPPSALAALSRASLVEQPTYGAVLAATGPLDEAARAGIEGLGILDPLVSEGEPLVRLPPLMADFFGGRYDPAELGPAAAVHQRVVDWWLAAGEPRQALRQALLGRRWALAVEILEEHWWQLLGADLHELPAAEVRGHPRAELAWQAVRPEDLARSSPATRAWETELRAGPPERLAERAGDPDVLAVLTLLLVRDRARGEHGSAEDLARRIEAVVGADDGPAAARVASLEAGRILLLAGDPVAATRSLRVAGAVDELALCAAVLGDRAATEQWLDRGRSASPTAARDVAVAFDALRSLDRHGSADALAALHSRDAGSDDLWPFAGWVEAQHALLWGGRTRVRAELAGARDSAARRRVSPGLRTLLDVAEADLCISLGRTAVAARLLADADTVSPSVLLSRARLARAVGHLDEALGLLDELASSGYPSSVIEVEALVLRAWCLDGADAADTLARAVRGARRDRLALPFAHVPASLLATHARAVPGLTPITELLRDAEVRAPYDVVDELPTLTPREAAVLAALARGLSLEEIGRELFVSRNTVKSQTASLYRKLRVSGRADAVRKASRVGLLD